VNLTALFQQVHQNLDEPDGIAPDDQRIVGDGHGERMVRCVDGGPAELHGGCHDLPQIDRLELQLDLAEGNGGTRPADRRSAARGGRFWRSRTSARGRRLAVFTSACLRISSANRIGASGLRSS
jgi:hypothetical protein